MNTATILIIEDDKVMLSSLSEILTSEGYLVREAENGKVGMNMALESKPQLVILDLNLPEVYGMTIMQKIREEGGDWGQNVSIIVLTNQDIDDATMNSIALYTPTFYLVKADMNLSQIVENVKSALEGK